MKILLISLLKRGSFIKMISLDRKFYVQNLSKKDKIVKIHDEEKQHLEVLRPSLKDKFWATNGKGLDFLCKIIKMNKKFFEVEVLKVKENKKYPLYLHLFFGVTKRKKWEWLIEKATEMGVLEFTPLITKNNQQYAKGFYKEKKLERFKRKVVAAMKQSRRSFLPKINKPVKFSTLQNHDTKIKNSFVLSFDGIKWKKKDVEKSKKLNLIVGPEGGFTEKEVKILEDKDAKLRNIGIYTLKTETAALKAVSLLTYFKEDF
ncbi:MAG: 16S rRNA (uracil(1498)-N(3))-methyltransferase [Candidatus Mcinerneyibacterium aminivorans]|uniref:Ribosomal RNA small subunit methyltransferase E n=1 Tax=Candidatus Mcinerneyibacterium aminivorans TaxID=2703815 RepID=A0A5D0MCS3_9BACT|nr:MAG: 16S rRNA (uracil(1498)-N(3))-methyltransferase [Candidatus Mcinerneyibacterium aminivorans]